MSKDVYIRLLSCRVVTYFFVFLYVEVVSLLCFVFKVVSAHCCYCC